ncbi:polysaccharide deacetylase family protein [Tepidimicrobium xylanilyticum]|uniref:Polysaccharide deacetylase family sporulation protein PdaB n=1 Tax=Tepidimicrobium xylanilyticum TaxID=1123352 RepID=A0A1H2YBB9_9FIRM|nr:polysaccharide deacetylase family protein [Tepidimicrobium xylanilyticum]GMG97089.1 polysaccharide deacetylase [Tepidimicrobium xylanilyticum]SDX02128.1 polysaccharide deacetylase family sporulation protein PdaB [Tepidimicrobium xylanilyticum]
MKVLIINKKMLSTFIIIFLIIIVVGIYFSFYNRADETFKIDIYYKGNVDDKIVSFACNVDWGNEYIEPMLKIFAQNNIEITFFVTGTWAKKNPELLKTIYNKGHEIGNHGYRHIDYDKLSYEGNREEILKAHNIIYNILGVEPKYFAPPSGAYNDNTIKAAKDLNYDIIMWSIDTIDWRDDSTKEKIINRVISKIHDSAIILMHPTKETVYSLPEIIEYLNNKGYKIGKISDVIK